MERLLTASDIAEHLSVTPRTAARYMRQMEHLAAPLRVSETALRAWEAQRTCGPVIRTAQKKRRIEYAAVPIRIERRRA